MENEAVREYIAHHAPEIQEQFDLALNTISMEEAVEKAEQHGSARPAAECPTSSPTQASEDDAP